MAAVLAAMTAVFTISPLVHQAAAACIPAVPLALRVMRHLPRLVMTAVMATAAAMVVEMVAVTVVETVEAMAVVTVAVTVAVMAVVTATAMVMVMATVMATVILLVMVTARRLVRVKAARALPCPSSTIKAARQLSLC